MQNKKIKVVHICVTDEGGAGLCCRRIHRAMKSMGIDSSVLTMLHFTDDKDVHKVHKNIKWLVSGIGNKIQNVLNLALTKKMKVKKMQSQINEPLSIPTSVYTHLYNHPLVAQADIIHLHSVTGFIDFPTFFKKVGKPIVWTLHDENLFNGLAHFSRTKVPDAELDKYFYVLKLKALREAKRLGIVFLSDMMYDKYHNHEMIQGCQSTIINNPVDITTFKPKDKCKAREKFGLLKDLTVLIFVAAFIEDPRKGLEALSRAVENLGRKDVIILAVGKKTDVKYPDFIKAVGPIYNTEELAEAYSAADFFISASYQEAFAQTPIEAMACGIPAILTPVSGSSELINDANGVRSDDFTSESIEKAIRVALHRKYDGTIIRQDIVNRFSTEQIARKYMSFYSHMLS